MGSFRVYSPQIGGTNVFFTDRSLEIDTPLVSWAWSFGDGTSSAERDPLHNYASPGRYDVALTVTDAAGQTAQRTFPYTAFGASAIDFSFCLPRRRKRRW